MATPQSDTDSIRDYGVAAPHGPNMAGGHHADIDIRNDMSQNESDVFHALLHPDDMYDADGTYWADMPLGKRVKFVTNVDKQEAKRELGELWQMMKKDPLSPVSAYFRNYVIPGAGLGLEGSVFVSSS
jgi:hypothetical protein